MVFLPHPSTELSPFLEQLPAKLWLRPQHGSWEAFLPRGMKPLPLRAAGTSNLQRRLGGLSPSPNPNPANRDNPALAASTSSLPQPRLPRRRQRPSGCQLMVSDGCRGHPQPGQSRLLARLLCLFSRRRKAFQILCPFHEKVSGFCKAGFTRMVTLRYREFQDSLKKPRH